MSLITAALKNRYGEGNCPNLTGTRHRAGVFLLCEINRERLILTKRAATLPHHPGEYCFPGGIWQPDDAGLIDTALRETQEELALDPSRIQVLTQLPPQTSLHGYAVFPFIGLIKTIQPYRANEAEVERVITVELSKVVNPCSYETFIQECRCVKLKSLRFIDEDYFIWGLTARVMRDFCYLWRSVL